MSHVLPIILVLFVIVPVAILQLKRKQFVEDNSLAKYAEELSSTSWIVGGKLVYPSETFIVLWPESDWSESNCRSAVISFHAAHPDIRLAQDLCQGQCVRLYALQRPLDDSITQLPSDVAEYLRLAA